MTDSAAIQALKQKQLEIAKIKATNAVEAPRKTALERLGSAAAEGFEAGYGEPVQGASPWVRENMIEGAPFLLRDVNRLLLETLPGMVQMAGKTIAGGVGGTASAVGQGLEELGVGEGTRKAVERGTRHAMSLPIIPEAAGLPAIAATRVGVTKPFRAPAKTLEEGAKTAHEIVAGRGATIPAQKLTTSPALDMAANAAATSFLGSGRLRRAEQSAEAAAQNAVGDFVNTFAGVASKEHVGEILQNAVEDAADAFRETAKGAYGAVDKAMEFDIIQAIRKDPAGAAGYVTNLIAGNKGAMNEAYRYQGMVDLRATKRATVDLFNEIAKGLQKPEDYGLFNNLIAKSDFVTFEEAQMIRSDLLGIGRTATETLPGRAQTYGKRLSPFVDRAMENAASTLNPQAIKVWRDANALWKQGKETFNSQVIKAVANKDSELVYQSVVRDGRPGSIRRVREIVGKEGWPAVEAQFVGDLVSKAADAATGDVSGLKLMSEIKKRKDSGIYSEVVTNAESAKNFEELARTLQLVQKGNESTAMKLRTSIGGGLPWGSIPEFGGLTLMYNIGVPSTLGQMAAQVGAGAIVLGPRSLSKILTNPGMSRLLIDGIGKPGLKGDRAAQRLIVALVAQGLVDKNQVPSENMRMLNAATARSVKRYNDERRLHPGL